MPFPLQFPLERGINFVVKWEVFPENALIKTTSSYSYYAVRLLRKETNELYPRFLNLDRYNLYLIHMLVAVS